MKTSKQVKDTSVELNSAQNPPQQRKLYIKVDTFNPEGREIGTRIVDMYHFGTRGWLQNHYWWAMHNSHSIESNPASELQVDEHMALQKKLLAEKFNNDAKHQAA